MTGRPRTCDCGQCRKCTHRETARKRYQSLTLDERRAVILARDPEKVRAADRARYYRNREERLDAQRRWKPKEDPTKRKARVAANNAIRDGRLTKQPCEICGARAEAHHDDYDRPLDVRWLCSVHHGHTHRRSTMNDEETTTAEDLADEDPQADTVAEEEETVAEQPPELDNAAIFAEAEARVVRMKENGRKDEDIARTYAGQVAMLKAQNDDAISAALMALATIRVSDKKVKEGPYNRRRLAVQVAGGSFNLTPEETEGP